MTKAERRRAADIRTRIWPEGSRRLAKIGAPTLIVHGDRDEFFPVSIPIAMYQSIPGAELWIVPGGTHAPTAGAEESAFESEVETFLHN